MFLIILSEISSFGMNLAYIEIRRWIKNKMRRLCRKGGDIIEKDHDAQEVIEKV